MFGNGPKILDPYVTTVGLVQKGRDPGSSQLLQYMMVLPLQYQSRIEDLRNRIIFYNELAKKKNCFYYFILTREFFKLKIELLKFL